MLKTIDRPESALVIIPHPDDGEGGCGGTIAKWISEGTKVYYILCTDGSRGTSDLNMSPDRLAEIRRGEQESAAQTLGVSEVVYLAHPDGELEDSREFRGELVRGIRRFHPDIVLTTEPYRFGGHQHRDHRITGQVALDACFPYARDPFHFAEHLGDGLLPHKVGTILFWGSAEPEVFVDITQTIEQKIEALRKHDSQVGDGRAGRFFNQRAQQLGEMAGVLYAEGFRRIDFRR